MLFTWNRDSFFFFLNIEANARQNRFIKTLFSLFFYFSVLQSLFVENAFFQTIINLNHIKSVFSAIAKKKRKRKKVQQFYEIYDLKCFMDVMHRFLHNL